ncbi:MAG: DeoR/GlpR family DNA-binding transcription regulator [Puniceicoccaceae bacterium]
MNLQSSDRHRRILDKLKRDGQVRNAELADEFMVTPMTLWRDLRLLEERGQLRRMRGGAVAKGVEEEPGFFVKTPRAAEAKQAIARRAVRFLEEGDILILDGGTTVAALTRQTLPARLTVLTNSLPIANELMHHPSRPSVQLAGGLLRPESGTVVGREALAFFGRRRANKLFMSATGVDAEAGITDPNPQEIEVKQAMLASAQQVYLMADASKFGHVSLMQTMPLRRINALVTDRRSDILAEALRREGGTLVSADGSDGPVK